jgi:hypothetical protein
MDKKNGLITINDILLRIFLSKKFINILKRKSIEKLFFQNKLIEERNIKQICYIQRINKDILINNDLRNDKIILVIPIKSWEKYGLKLNAHSLSIYEQLMNISFQDFSLNKKDIIMIKTKIKKIKEYGSSMFCSLFFNKELNKMINVSVGNILYSILRENKSHKYEIIYISTEQYHDINIPFQISPLNHDYNNINLQWHDIMINDIIIISNNKKTIFDFNEYINNKNNYNNFFDELEVYNKNEMADNLYFYAFKIIKEQNDIINNDNISIFSTSQES